MEIKEMNERSETKMALETIRKIMEPARSWCNHDELFEEDTMGLPIKRSYIFRCKCGKTRLLKPPEEQMNMLREDSSITFF